MRRTAARRGVRSAYEELPNEAVSPLFQAVSEATEEAALDALFVAGPMDGDRGRIEALPTEEIVRAYRDLSRRTDETP